MVFSRPSLSFFLGTLFGGAVVATGLLYATFTERKNLYRLRCALKNKASKTKRKKTKEKVTKVSSPTKTPLRSALASIIAKSPHVLLPIGFVQSCFSDCQGTPRQPSLAPATRAILHFKNNVPSDAFASLELYSHIWILFIFHENTNSQKLLKAHTDASFAFPAKCYPPRAKGQRVGVFATRTPHRPNPIGLSVAKIVSINPSKHTVVVSGIDLVDGSPIIDIKPYLPAFDSLSGNFPECQAQSHIKTRVPSWVTCQQNAVPRCVEFSEEAENFLKSKECENALCGGKKKKKENLLFPKGATQWRNAITQVLSVDVSRPPNERRTFDVNFAGLRANYSILPTANDTRGRTLVNSILVMPHPGGRRTPFQKIERKRNKKFD